MLLKKKYILQKLIYKRTNLDLKNMRYYDNILCRNCENGVHKLSGVSCSIVYCSALTIFMKMKLKKLSIYPYQRCVYVRKPTYIII